jgi:solute carrier family 25 protein 44
VVSGLCYVSTYEGVRHVLDSHGVRNNKVKALLGGASASLVGQTIIVPFDVISQHLMVLGTLASNKGADLAANPLAVPTQGRSKAQVAWDVTRQFF